HAEDSDAFLKTVESFALGADEGVVAALEREALCLVSVEIGDAALGALRGHDMDHAAVGKMPPVLLLGALLVALERLFLPFAVVPDLGQAAEVAQSVEHGAVRWLGREPCVVELPELLVGGVEVGQRLLGAENRDGGRDAVERAVVGGGQAVELVLGG